MSKLIKVACPNCQKEIIWDNDNPFRPFCSERCKLIDFGAWVNERHVIAGEPQEISDNDLLDSHSQK